MIKKNSIIFFSFSFFRIIIIPSINCEKSSNLNKGEDN
jgi:hypothetical protein